MIIHCYDRETDPAFTLKDFYGEQKHLVDLCLIIFSKEIHTHMLETFKTEVIGTLAACKWHLQPKKLCIFVSYMHR